MSDRNGLESAVVLWTGAIPYPVPFDSNHARVVTDPPEKVTMTVAT